MIVTKCHEMMTMYLLRCWLLARLATLCVVIVKILDPTYPCMAEIVESPARGGTTRLYTREEVARMAVAMAVANLRGHCPIDCGGLHQQLAVSQCNIQGAYINCQQ